MKHLEGLVVNYDLTVRHSDGNVIQFQYDEYGLAVEKCTYLKEAYYQFLVANQSTILHQDEYSCIVDICSFSSSFHQYCVNNLQQQSYLLIIHEQLIVKLHQ